MRSLIVCWLVFGADEEKKTLHKMMYLILEKRGRMKREKPKEQRMICTIGLVVNDSLYQEDGVEMMKDTV